MSVLCVVLIAMVWLLTVAFFEPNYHRIISSELSRRLSAVTQVLNSASSVSEVTDQLNDYVKDGVCIDISNSAYECLGISEGIGSNCMLHRESGAVFGVPRTNANSDTAVRLRRMVRQNGAINYTLEGKDGLQQALQGTMTDNGYIVIVSTNLERVTQAVAVMRSQLVLITVILLMISVVAALLFARWFTRPLTRLS
ncbi:MAG: hypothetical protein RR075_06230, partial [Pygmaiobacter sp.]